MNSLFMLLNYYVAHSQENNKMQFHLLGQEDDFSFLSGQEIKSFYESLKWIDLNNHSSLSFGGGYRFQLESFGNENFSEEPNEDNLWNLNRIMLHSSLRLGNQFEFYVELSSSTLIDKDNIVTVDKDVLNVSQAFFRYRFNSNWNILVGRENLNFGSRRLVELREGPNVRRSFDLVRLDYKKESSTIISAFFSIPVQNRPKAFDNHYLKFDETFTGIYATKNFTKSLNLDIYGFYQKDDNVSYNVGKANERRFSIGTRFFGKINEFTFNNEAVFQFGKFDNLDIRAYTISFNAEYFGNFITNPTIVGLKAEVISGDRMNNDNVMNTFDALYPRGAYFGRVAKIGPSNLVDIHPYLNIKKTPYYFELDYDAFWRYSVADGVYGASMLLDFPSTNDKPFIGQQFGTVIGYDMNNHLNIEFETNIIFPGSFLQTSGLSSTLVHAVITTELKF